MPSESYLKCPCKNCGSNLEFPVEGIGRSIRCPHCGEETELVRSTEETFTPKRKKPILIGALICCALAGAMAFGIFAARKKSEPPFQRVNVTSAMKPAQTKEAPIEQRETVIKSVKKISPAGVDWNGLKSGEITIEKSGSRLLYAVGTIRNESDRERFAVKVELELFDTNETRIGSASDYTQVIEPRKEWRFRALVTDPKAIRAEVINIKEN